MTYERLIPGKGWVQETTAAQRLIPGKGWVSESVATSPIARPSTDLTTTGWTASTGTDLFACIDEVTYDDADYIISPAITGSQGPYIAALNQSLAAGSNEVHFRADYTVSAAQVKVTLLDAGGSSVGDTGWQAVTGSLASYSLPVTTSGIATKVKIEVQ